MDTGNNTVNGPFTQAKAAWIELIKRAQEVKDKRFNPEAREGLKFFTGHYHEWFQQIRNDKFFNPGADAAPSVTVTMNKSSELVQLFGPTMYHQNPTRMATTRPMEEFSRALDPNLFVSDPQMMQTMQQAYQQTEMEGRYDKAVGALFEALGNVSPNKLDLETHARMAIDEALITGMGLLWHDYCEAPATGDRMCGSFWGSVKYFLLDPDANSMKNIRCCMRQTWMTTYEAERKFNLPFGTLAPSKHSNAGLAAGAAGPSGDGAPKKDLVGVWEIWSKMGCGGRLPITNGCDPSHKVVYELMGDYCYLAVVEDHPWPLNLPPWMFIDNPNCWKDAKKALQWPTPFWMLDDGWPFTPIYFHTVPDEVWPLSHMTPGMGYLKFLNWAFAKMASKIQVTSRDMLFLMDTATKAYKEAIKRGGDLLVVEMQGVESAVDISKLVYQFQHQPWNVDFFKVIGYMTEAFERATGLNELIYGQSANQMRSAAEADHKFEQLSVRPDDMAGQVSKAMSVASSREALCSLWHLRPTDVDAQLGSVAAVTWTVLVMPDPKRFFRIQMRIESDSTQKPNKSNLIANLKDMMQVLMPFFQQLVMAGMPQQYNALVGAWTDAVGVPDKQQYAITQQPPPPPEPPSSGEKK
jgi:hypothetical protein